MDDGRRSMERRERLALDDEAIAPPGESSAARVRGRTVCRPADGERRRQIFLDRDLATELAIAGAVGDAEPPCPRTETDLVAADDLPGLSRQRNRSSGLARSGTALTVFMRVASASAPLNLSGRRAGHHRPSPATGLQRRRCAGGHRRSVHRRPIHRAQILDLQRLSGETQPGMATRYRGVGYRPVRIDRRRGRSPCLGAAVISLSSGTSKPNFLLVEIDTLEAQGDLRQSPELSSWSRHPAPASHVKNVHRPADILDTGARRHRRRRSRS